MEARAQQCGSEAAWRNPAQLDRAARLAVKTGGIEAATRVICELDAERAKIERRLASGSPAPDLNTLRQVIEDRCQVDVVAGEGFARLRNEAKLRR